MVSRSFFRIAADSSTWNKIPDNKYIVVAVFSLRTRYGKKTSAPGQIIFADIWIISSTLHNIGCNIFWFFLRYYECFRSLVDVVDVVSGQGAREGGTARGVSMCLSSIYKIY